MTARLILILALTIAAPPLARAQGSDDAPYEKAKAHFTRGITLYNDGNFGGALVEFETAFAIHPVSAVLYNIALTQKALFRYAESIDRFQRYLADAKSLSSERRQEVDRLIAEMKSLMAEVTLRVSPEGASVIVDGRAVGTAPLAPLGLAAGHHIIEASAEGHRPLRRELTLAAGVPVTITVELEPVPRTGRVEIQTSVPGARVTLDGKSAGHSPLGLEVLAGGHSLEVAIDGYQSYRGELVITPGQRRNLSVTLERITRPTPVYRRWWFWTIGAAVVAGTAVALGVSLGQQPVEHSTSTLGAARVDR